MSITPEGSLLRALQRGSLSVAPEKVAAVSRVLKGEAARLTREIVTHRDAAAQIPPLGRDPVSGDATLAFPRKIDELLRASLKYVRELEDAAAQLASASASYADNEHAIDDALRSVDSGFTGADGSGARRQMFSLIEAGPPVDPEPALPGDAFAQPGSPPGAYEPGAITRALDQK